MKQNKWYLLSLGIFVLIIIILDVRGISFAQEKSWRILITATGQNNQRPTVEIGMDANAVTYLLAPNKPGATTYITLNGEFWGDIRELGTGRQVWYLNIDILDSADPNLPGYYPELSWDPNHEMADLHDLMELRRGYNEGGDLLADMITTKNYQADTDDVTYAYSWMTILNYTVIYDPNVCTIYYQNLDGDTYGDSNYPVGKVTQPSGYAGYSEIAGDCDDMDPNSYPGALEMCDGKDNDCDGIIPGDEVDKDNDGALACADCDDSEPTRYPGAQELCDGKDNDCDGEEDEDFNLQTDPNNCGSCGHKCEYIHAASSCDNGDCRMGDCDDGYSDLNEDPNDGCEYECSVSNNGIEIDDEKDNDCDGEIDEVINTYYLDSDHDGYGDPNISVNTSSQPSNYVTNNTDCDDTNVEINPEMAEWSNGLDDNCNKIIDEVPPTVFSDPPLSNAVGVKYIYSPTADGYPSITWSFEVAPDAMAVDPNTGKITWIPDPNQVGDHSITLKAENVIGFDDQTWTISVNPVITSTPSESATVGEEYIYSPVLIGKGTTHWSLIEHPDGVSFNSDSGEIVWNPVQGQIQDNEVILKVTVNGKGDTQSWTITVKQSSDKQPGDDGGGGCFLSLFLQSLKGYISLSP